MIRINTNKPAKTAPQPRGIRQTMSDLHIWAGLLVGWILYAMFLTGTVSYFKEEISQWMRPELPHQAQVPDAAQATALIARELQTLAAGSGIFDFLAAATASGSDSFSATGKATDTNTVSGKVTVTVIEVQPNGNMVIEGTQSIWQNRDEHKITLRGVVRQDDILGNNTVSSSLVADATLKVDGKGPLNAKQRQGILTQVFNILF